MDGGTDKGARTQIEASAMDDATKAEAIEGQQRPRRNVRKAAQSAEKRGNAIRTETK